MSFISFNEVLSDCFFFENKFNTSFLLSIWFGHQHQTNHLEVF
jgi:hypothetical protein